MLGSCVLWDRPWGAGSGRERSDMPETGYRNSAVQRTPEVVRDRFVDCLTIPCVRCRYGADRENSAWSFYRAASRSSQESSRTGLVIDHLASVGSLRQSRGLVRIAVFEPGAAMPPTPAAVVAAFLFLTPVESRCCRYELALVRPVSLTRLGISLVGQGRRPASTNRQRHRENDRTRSGPIGVESGRSG